MQPNNPAAPEAPCVHTGGPWRRARTGVRCYIPVTVPGYAVRSTASMLACVVPLLAQAIGDASPPGTRTVSIVEDGRPQAAIVTGTNTGERVAEAARCLRDYVQKASGAALAIRTERGPGDVVALCLGAGFLAADQRSGLDDPDSFVIAFPDRATLVLAGASDVGTEYAVYEFLERYLGVRWLFPGEVGEVVPPCRDIRIARRRIEQQPAFLFRSFSVIGEASHRTWLRRLRMSPSGPHQRLEAHHNLGRLFPVAKFGASHPEFYPVHQGKRFIPDRPVSWQPCFSATGLVEAAANEIRNYFAANPDAPSYSFGVNDNAGHCRCDPCLSRVPNRLNWIGQADYSNLYYGWMNRVVADVRRDYPDKRFGCLAYNRVFNPPRGITLDDHIIPMIVFERYQWVDETIRLKIQQVQRDWESAAGTLGWADYLYGRPYLFPKVWFHAMGDSLRYGYEHKVRYYLAEAPQHYDWREGPKLYVALKLLWNPYCSVDDLLEEWCRLAVGPKAASNLRAYYALLERVWTDQAPQTPWFNASAGTLMLDFNSADHLDAITLGDIDACDRLLRKMVDQAGPGPERARSALIRAGFDTWSADVRSRIERRPVATRELIGAADRNVNSNTWNLGGGVLFKAGGRPLFRSVTNAYEVLSHRIDIAQGGMELADCVLSTEIQAMGDGSPLLGVCVSAHDARGNRLGLIQPVWNAATDGALARYGKRVAVQEMLDGDALQTCTHLQVRIYNVSWRDRPGSAVIVGRVSLAAERFDALRGGDFEQVENGAFTRGSDAWRTGGQILVETNAPFLRFEAGSYVALMQVWKFDKALRTRLSEHPVWRVEVDMRGEGNPRVGLVIGAYRQAQHVPARSRQVFWNVPLGRPWQSVVHSLPVSFLLDTAGPEIDSLAIILYRCDLKTNPAARIDVSRVSFRPEKTRPDTIHCAKMFP